MILADPRKQTLEDLLELYPEMSHDVFYLGMAKSFTVRFGVFHGESITSLDYMNAGDVYQVSYDANWTEVFRLNEDTFIFSLPLSSGTELYTLQPYAYLTFMSESGQTFDVWPVRIYGIDHIITSAPFRFCEEYTLIEIHDDTALADSKSGSSAVHQFKPQNAASAS
jgi:hypothetical protein